MLNETFSVIFKHRGPLENHSGLQDTFLSKKYLSKDNIFGKEILSLLNKFANLVIELNIFVIYN